MTGPRLVPAGLRVYGPGACLALAGGAYHTAIFSPPTNDNFMHMALARQLVGGDVPVVDFFDSGLVLMYGLSALAETIVGYRLLAEALLVGAMSALSIALVYAVTWKLTASRVAAVLAALLVVLAGPRGYSYPKLIVYAGAAALWWAYVRKPGMPRLLALGAWTAVAFYWRPDHGVYVAAGVVLASVAAHGTGLAALRACAVAGGLSLLLTAPFFLFVQIVMGLPAYVATGYEQGRYEHVKESHAWPEWPVRDIADVVRLGPAAEPTTIGSQPASPPTRARVAEAERGFRLQLFPGVEDRRRAGEAVAMLCYLLPVLTALIAAWPGRTAWTGGTSRRALLAFAAFGLVVDFGLLRTPYDVRAVDAVVLPSIMAGWCLALLMQLAARVTAVRRVAVLALSVLAGVLVLKSVAVAGDAGPRLRRLTGDFEVDRARAVWRELAAELTASPPERYWQDRPARGVLRLAGYVRTCVPERDRLLVLWFAPDLYYYANRLMAHRHVVFVPAWRGLDHEEPMTLAKIRRYDPPIALATEGALNAYAAETHPRVVDYVRREYAEAGRLEVDGERYLVFARRGRSVLGRYGEHGWPCYAPAAPSR